MILNRDFNKGLWNIVAELKKAASVSQVPYQTVKQITENLERLLRKNYVFDLNKIPSPELTGALLGAANLTSKWADHVPGREPRERSSRDKKLLKSLQFWTKLARDLKHKRRSESEIASSLGLSLEELLHVKDELKEKGWFDQL